MAEDPWRTQGDYREEQQRLRKLFKLAYVSAICAALAVIVQAVSVTAVLWKAAPTVQVECVAPAVAASPPATAPK